MLSRVKISVFPTDIRWEYNLLSRTESILIIDSNCDDCPLRIDVAEPNL